MFKVISPRLLNSQVRIETSIASCACQLLIVLERDVAARPRIFVPLRQAKIDYVDNMLLFSKADQKVIWFDVTMNKAIQMDKLYPLKHLNSQHQYRLERKATTAVLI